MGNASCLLRFRGNALSLATMADELGVRHAKFRGDLRGPPDWNGIARDARGEIYMHYTCVRWVMSVLPPDVHARLAALGLGTRVEVTDALG
ncbi:MAG TPA: hypothetical protein VGH28_09690 [Polyangiaceae bacterium]|jgi:hypothetical protein